MTKLASENATNKANAQGFSLKEGRAAVDGQVAADPAAKAAVAAPVKAALNAKAGAGVVPAVPVKASAHVDAVKKEERDEDGKLINKASDEAEGKGEHLAMVDASASAAVGTLSPEAGQDAGGASASDSSDDDSGDSTPLIIGGVVLLGGGVALAAGGGGGGSKTPANTAPVVSAQTNKGNEDTTISGKLTATDANNDTLTYAASGTLPAGVTLNSDGSYSLDGKNAAYQSLAAGATKDVVVNFTVSDGKGGTASSTLTITVTGVNDAPTTSAATATATEDAAAAVTGKLTAADVDTGDTQTFSLNAPVAGLTLNADGSYSFDAKNAAYQSLAKDQVKDVVANFTVTDKSGATATSTLTIKVTGVNDAPTTSAQTAAATEDAPVVTGKLTAADVDTGDTQTFSLNAPVAGLTLNADGSYSFDPSNAAYQSLAKDQVKDVVANFTVTDKSGATATSTLTIKVTGVNDSPTVAAAQTVATNEDEPKTITVTGADVDGDTLTYTAAGATKGVVTAGATAGTFIYTPNANVNGADSFTVTVSDGKGGTATQTVTVNIAPVNDAPVAIDDTFTFNEGQAYTDSVATNDSDIDGGTLKYSLVGTAPAGVVLDEDGKFVFNGDNIAYNHLAAGETEIVTFNYSVSDGNGGTANAKATITVTGVNDAPVAAAATAAATEDGAIVTGQLVATDVDTKDTLTYSLNAPVTGLVINPNGSYSFDPASYDSIAAGETKDVVANYTVSDGNGGTATSTLTITVTGVNDVPVAVAATAAATEDAAAVTGQLAATDVDTKDTLTYSLNAPVTGLVINPNGSYSFDPASYDSLAAGETKDVVANYTVSDGNGGTATSTLTITVTGVNDAPVAVAATAAATEDAAVVTGQLAATDVDTSDTLTYSLDAPVAGLVINADGSYSFDPASYDSIAAGETKDVVANYTVSDGNGGTATSTLTITVTGVNDDPVITSSATATVEERTSAATPVYTTIATDVDNGDTLTYSLLGADKDAFNISNTGVVTLKTSANYEVQDVYNFTVVVTDNHGGQDSQAVVLTVTDVIDPLSLDVAGDADLLTLEIVDAAGSGIHDINYGFTESLAIDNFVRVDNFGANDFIQFDTNPTGYSYSSNGNGDLIIENTNGGKFSSITLAGAVAPNAFVTDYASAEAALDAKHGAGDYLRGAVASANVSLDDYPGNDNDPSTFETLSATGAATIFTDLGSKENSVIITGFSNDDRIVGTKTLTGDPTYSFSQDFNDPRDLRIEYVSGTNVSVIILDDVIPQNFVGLIQNEAQAEQALGFDFFSYA